MQNSTSTTFGAIVLFKFKHISERLDDKLMEPIRFEKKLGTDRYTDSSALDKLRWLYQQKQSKNGTTFLPIFL